MDIEQHITKTSSRSRFRVMRGLSMRLRHMNSLLEGNLAKLTISNVQLKTHHIWLLEHIPSSSILRHDDGKQK
jgi:hypothetical protein